MLASISPLGERARGNRWTVTASAYTVASILAGAALGTVLGALFDFAPGRFRLAAIAAAAVVAGAVDLVSPQRLPGWHRQVDEDWLSRLRGWVYGAGYGGQLGVGVVTIVSTATLYAWLVAAAAAGSAAGGAVVGAAFGAARAAPLLTVRRADSPAALRATLARLSGWAARGRVAAAACSIAVGAGALGSVVAGR